MECNVHLNKVVKKEKKRKKPIFSKCILLFGIFMKYGLSHVSFYLKHHIIYYIGAAGISLKDLRAVLDKWLGNLEIAQWSHNPAYLGVTF